MGRMLTAYHNHSTWSDGRASVSGYLETARSMGIEEPGVSDHFALHPSGEDPARALPRHQLGDYVRDGLRQKDDATAAGGPIVRPGLEADWFTDSADPTIEDPTGRTVLRHAHPAAYDILREAMETAGQTGSEDSGGTC
ncbi:MAG: hypothetical protein JSV91_15805 [Phycisphaerales bacterium]|nr:MAG: hypothetical protein JSV91_15805 [Phycisphaerales bacterium]